MRLKEADDIVLYISCAWFWLATLIYTYQIDQNKVVYTVTQSSPNASARTKFASYISRLLPVFEEDALRGPGMQHHAHDARDKSEVDVEACNLHS